jgi:hypothetical protein
MTPPRSYVRFGACAMTTSTTYMEALTSRVRQDHVERWLNLKEFAVAV